MNANSNSTKASENVYYGVLFIVLYLAGFLNIPQLIADAFFAKGGIFEWISVFNGVAYNICCIFLVLVIHIFGKNTKSLFSILPKSVFQLRDRSNVLIFFSLVCLVFAVRSIFPMGNPVTIHYPYYLLFHFLILVPIVEEILFRGIFQTILFQAFGIIGNQTIPIAVSTLIFVSVHDWRISSPFWILFLGAVLGFCYQRFKSINCCIVIHSIWNLFLFKIG